MGYLGVPEFYIWRENKIVGVCITFPCCYKVDAPTSLVFNGLKRECKKNSFRNTGTYVNVKLINGVTNTEKQGDINTK